MVLNRVAVYLGAVIIFTGVFSRVFLRRRLGPLRWLGIAFVIVGLATVGICDMIYGKHDGGGGKNETDLAEGNIVRYTIIKALVMISTSSKCCSLLQSSVVPRRVPRRLHSRGQPRLPGGPELGAHRGRRVPGLLLGGGKQVQLQHRVRGHAHRLRAGGAYAGVERRKKCMFFSSCQVIVATQMVYEEKFISKYDVPALQVC